MTAVPTVHPDEAADAAAIEHSSTPIAPRARLLRLLGIGLVLRATYWIAGLLIGALAGRSSPPLGLWSRWDARHILSVAQFGYVHRGADAAWVAFLPLYPALVRLVAYIVPNYIASGLVVSLATAVGAAAMLTKLVALEATADESWHAALFLLFFPTAYFLATPYTEGVFLLSSIAAMYAARTNRWTWAGVFGACAMASRLVGVAIVPALAFAALSTAAPLHERVRRLAAASISGVGLLVYIAINLRVYGDAFHFLNVERVRWHQHFVTPWSSVITSVQQIVHPQVSGAWFWLVYPTGLFAAGVAVALLVRGRNLVSVPDQIFGWGVLILSLCESRLISLPRYLLSIYPLFIVLGRTVRSRTILVAICGGGIALQLVLFARYALGQWAF